MIRIAWIGLGNLGRGACRCLVERGNLDYPLVLYNRTLSRAEELSAELGESKTKVARTISDAVTAADIIFTCLTNDKAVKEVMKEALMLDVSGKTFVDCTTVHPDVTNGLAETAEKHSANLAAMPGDLDLLITYRVAIANKLTVLGSPSMAEAGQLICVLAGSVTAVERVRPYTVGIMGRAVIELNGEPAGRSSLLKIIANAFIANIAGVLAEGLTFAEKTSVPPQKLQELVTVIFGGPYAIYASRMVDGDYHKKKAQVPVEMALKDVHHALNIAADVGCKLPTLQLLEGHLQVKSRMGSEGDSSGVYGVLREESGLPFEN